MLYLNTPPAREHLDVVSGALDVAFAHTDCPNVHLRFGPDLGGRVHAVWNQLIDQYGRLSGCSRVAILLPVPVQDSRFGPGNALAAEVRWFSPGEADDSWAWANVFPDN